MKLAFQWKDVIISWVLLTAFFFAGILAYSLAQPRYYAPTPEMWPPALTKAEIQTWATAVQPFHKRISETIIAFSDDGQKDFAVSLTKALSDAEWPEPSLQPNNWVVGARVVAAKDVYDVGEQLQKLMQSKVGPTRLDKAERATENPDEKNKTVPPGKMEILIGWKPKD